MYQALYRKWRPTAFEDVVGQAHITSVLKSEVQSGRISHAYLFCGPRGTGKTTCAKIIAKAANCEHPVNGDPCGECAACRSVDTGNCTDVIEMDAASNNGVDAIRDIRDAVVYTPSELKYRVYIIDEVHMLSISAFNALLKTLEEPPEHVIFILATTELHKIPATVLSRCQRFDFHRITPDAMIARLKTVCEGEGFTADDESLALIARLSQGAMRDALNMLEYCASEGGTIMIESASRMLGAASTKLLGELADALASRDAAAALAAVEEIYGSSRDISVFWRELISFYRDMLIFLSTKGRMGADKPAASHAAGYTVPALFSLLEILIAAEGNMQKQPTSAKLYAEMALIRACDPTPTASAPAPTPAVPQEKKTVAPEPRPSSEPKPAVPESKPSSEPTPTVRESAPTPSAPPASSGKSGRTPVRRWGDVVRRIAESDMGFGTFLRGSLALEGDDGYFYVIFENPFAVKLTGNEKKGVISATVKAVTGKDYPIERILCTAAAQAGDILDEPMEILIQKMEEWEGENQ